jgi:tetratricopeptide (TPR) repeat protein
VKRHFWISLLAAVGLALPLPSRAVVPYTPTIDFVTLREQGIALAQQAAQLIQFQQFPLAQRYASLAAQLAPDDYRVWLVLADTDLRTNDIDGAIVSLNKAESLGAKDPAIQFALGTAYIRKKEYDKAIAQIRAGLAVKPNSPAALFDLGNAFLLQGKSTDALSTFGKAVQLKADFWEAINNMGIVSYEEGKTQAALDYWQRAITLSKKAAEPVLARASALYQEGQREEAIAQAKEALQSDGQYADIAFLKDQLWGKRLIQATEELFKDPKLQQVVQDARLSSKSNGGG